MMMVRILILPVKLLMMLLLILLMFKLLLKLSLRLSRYRFRGRAGCCRSPSLVRHNLVQQRYRLHLLLHSTSLRILKILNLKLKSTCAIYIEDEDEDKDDSQNVLLLKGVRPTPPIVKQLRVVLKAKGGG